jgi:hypothetical protein
MTTNITRKQVTINLGSDPRPGFKLKYFLTISIFANKTFCVLNIIGRITIRNRGVAEALPRRFKMVTLRKARTPLNSNTTKTQERDGSPERFCPGLLVTRGEMGQTSPIEGLQKRPNTTKSTLSVFSKYLQMGKS